MKWAIDNGFDYVFLHNGDGYLDAGCVDRLIEAMETDKQIGAAQALALLHPENGLINTSGNLLHFLGFGFCGHYREQRDGVNLPKVGEIGYASGAAVMLRTDLLKQYGLWDEDFFLYHEDTDYSLRLKMRGYKIVAVRDAVFFHQYAFSKSKSKFFWLERNRLALLLIYYKLPSLILLWPLKIILELGLLAQALAQGWISEWWKSRIYWAHLSNWRLWLSKRKTVQKNRKISDRDVLKTMVPTISFSDQSVANPVLKYVGNPIMWVYYWILRIFIRW
jgi:GT2 family glycosyltransferase